MLEKRNSGCARHSGWQAGIAYWALGILTFAVSGVKNQNPISHLKS